MLQKIAELRKHRGLTQEELADKTGLTVRTIQRIENGESVPRSFTLKAIAAELNVPFEELMATPVAGTQSKAGVMPDENRVHFLQMLTLSCFSYIVVPFVHFLIPGWILKKRPELDATARRFANGLIRHQVYWVISFHLTMLLTVAWNLSIKKGLASLPIISYLNILFLFYIVNALLIAGGLLRLRKSVFTVGK